MGATRLARAWLLAVVWLTSGSLAHLGGGGTLPGIGSLALLGLLLTVAAAALPPRASVSGLVGLTVGGQTVVHLALLSMTAGAAPAPAAHAIHAHPGGATSSAPDSRMWLAHLAAAVLVGLWLAYGEAAIFRVLALALAAIRRVLVVPRLYVTARVPSEPAGTRVPAPMHTLLAGAALGRRGPPELPPLTS